MSVSDDRLAAVAAEAARAGGAYLRKRFRTGPVTAEYGPDDVRAEVDRQAERRVVEVIRESFPEHRVYAEESDENGTASERDHDSDRDDTCRWFVDPLDGTNNFASGLATFATAIAVRRRGRTRAAAIYEPIPDDLYLARRGAGATVDGEPISADSDVDLEHGTVSLVVGLAAIGDPALRAEADRIERALDGACKRVLQTWAPCVDWGLLARGGIEGLVAFHPPAYERYAGRLIAAESGVRATGDEECYVGACEEETLTELVDVLEEG